MMLDIIVFFIGVHAMMELLAAAYGYIDLWYRIQDYWIKITTRLSLIAAMIGLIYAFLPEDLRPAFLAGLVAYFAFHIMLFWFGRFGVGLLGRKR